MFRMAMQCQVIDDVVDYREDLAAGLPSLLTASASWDEAVNLTAHAARSYAAGRSRRADGHAFPFDIALHVLTVVTRLVIAGARRPGRRR
jgi:hypothetical protein